ncbi:hypothetical protein [Metabacillus litoralis]|uniref:hypothetical protein n=1 Tax=Metabacillus litoralis TaxID=152268 RepID=UPI000A80A58C|nr:hypothetical protein [Metabacillus litoralis]
MSNVIKKFYAAIEDKGKSYLLTYETDSEDKAYTYFKKIAQFYEDCTLRIINT